MNAILLLWLLAQGVPVLPGQSGTISGVLRSADGRPAVGVRVAAMARPDSAQEALSGSAMSSLAETDEAGRFRLENIPPGRYYLVAGRLDLPTFYPGTQDVNAAAVFAITPGANVSGVDFIMNQTSAGRAYVDGFGGIFVAGATIPVQLTLENGVKLPVFVAGRFTSTDLRLTSVSGGGPTVFPASSSTINVPAGEYNVSVGNLPDGCIVKSITYGGTDLTTGTMKVVPVGALVSGAGTVTRTRTFQGIISFSPTAGGGVVITSASSSTLSLSITLTTTSNSPADQNGVRVTGRMKDIDGRSLYLSGLPGTIYVDGSFEFRGVPPGRHTIATPDHPAAASPYAASVVVGNRDIDGITLDETPVLPPDVRDVTPPAQAGVHPVGVSLPLVAVRGRVLSEATRQPMSGFINIIGLRRASYPIDADGRFEISGLLPGQYALEIAVPDRPALNQTVVVADENVNVELTVP